MFARFVRRMRGTSGDTGSNGRSVSPAVCAAGLWLLATLALVLPSGLAAQTGATIQGTVTDPSGAVVPEATVSVQARDASVRRRTLTGSEGAYRIEALPAGVYVVTVEAANFATSASRNVTFESGEEETLDIELALDRLRNEVVVTASTTPLTADQVSKALDTVSSREANLRGEHTVAEALRQVPGLRVRQQRGPGGNTSVQIRGMRTEDTAVLIDGHRFRDGAAIGGDAGSFLADLMIANTERIEVLRGSGSSIYGTGATGGAVNIVSDQGGGRPHGEIRAEGGGLGLLRGLARFGGGALGARLNYSGGISHLNVNRGVDGSDAYRNSTAHGVAQYAFSPPATLSGRIFTADTFIQLNDSAFVPFEAEAGLPPTGAIKAIALPLDQQRKLEAGQPFEIGNANFVPDVNDPDNRRSASFLAASVGYAQRLSRAASFRVDYQIVDAKRNFRNGPGGVRFEPQFNNSSSFDSRIGTARVRTDLELGPQHLFSLGYEFEREQYDSPSTDEHPDPAQRVTSRAEMKQSSHIVFAQDQIRLFDNRLQLSLSGRARGFRLSQPTFTGGDSPYAAATLEPPKTALTGDGAISYHFADSGTKVRVHVGNAFKAPSMFQRFGSSFFFGSFSTFGDPRLRPERTLAIDGGLDQWVAGGRVKLSGTYFYTRLQEVIIFDFSGGIDPSTDSFGRFGGYRNTGGGLARGVELSVSAVPAQGADVRASYTYTNSDQRTSEVATGDFFRTFGVSGQIFVVTLLQRIGRRVDVAFDFFAASDNPAPFFTTAGTRPLLFAGPKKADVMLTYTMPLSDRRRVKIFGKVENAFDHEYFELGFRSPGTWGVVGMSFGF